MHQLNISQKASRLSNWPGSIISLHLLLYSPPSPPTFGGGGQPHLSGSYLTSGLQTRVHRGAAEVRAIPNTLKTADGAPVSKSANLSAEVSHAFNQPSLKKKNNHRSLSESPNFKKLLFQNELCKIIQHTRNFTHLKKQEHFCFWWCNWGFTKVWTWKKKKNVKTLTGCCGYSRCVSSWRTSKCNHFNIFIWYFSADDVSGNYNLSWTACVLCNSAKIKEDVSSILGKKGNGKPPALRPPFSVFTLIGRMWWRLPRSPLRVTDISHSNRMWGPGGRFDLLPA